MALKTVIGWASLQTSIGDLYHFSYLLCLKWKLCSMVFHIRLGSYYSQLTSRNLAAL